MSEAPRHCPACGSARISLHGTKSGEFLRREFEFHRCADCGFLSVHPFSGWEIYNDAYYRGAGPDPYVDYAAEYENWQHTDRVHEFEDLARLATAYLTRTAGPTPSSFPPPLAPPASRLAPLHWLDFGCGAGGFLKFLRARGTLAGRPLELTGHDVGSYANLLRDHDRFRILDLDAIRTAPDATFDVISMIEVVEHLPAPLEPLRLVARLLKPGGLLLLTTGNLTSAAARAAGLGYRYCAPEIHVSLFNPVALAHLYARAGLTPYPVSYDGAIRFKVLKTLRHRPALRAAAALALRFPPILRAIDRRYGVSAMPCATKPIVA